MQNRTQLCGLDKYKECIACKFPNLCLYTSGFVKTVSMTSQMWKRATLFLHDNVSVVQVYELDLTWNNPPTSPSLQCKTHHMSTANK